MMKIKFLLGLTLLLGGLALCGAGLWLLLSPPQYAATARIKIENDLPDSSGNISYDPYFIQTSFEAIQCQIVLSNVVADLNLNVVWGKKYSNGKPLKYVECYVILKNHLQLTPVRNTRLIKITYYSDNSKEAADVANAIAKAYNDYCLKSQKALAAKGIEILQRQYQEEEKLNMKTPATMMVQIVGPAEPPQFPASTNRPLGAALLAVGLFPLLGGILLLKSKP